MGPLKDELFSSVWTHLQSMPKCQTLLTALNHPISGSQTIRNAWAALKDNGTNEGINTATGLQSALAARPDIFYFETTDRGHQLIGLTYGARALSPASGIPESVPHVAEPPPETDTNPSVAQLQALVEAEDSGMLANFTTAIMERPSKSLRLAKGKGKGIVSEGPNSCEWGGHWNGRVYVDIVWTPELARKKTEERQKEMKLVRALYRALDMHKGDSVSLSQLGSDFKVSELKKDPHFKNWRLLDILKEYENVFEILPLAGGICVKLQPGAEAALPDAEAAAEHVNEAELMLPERIENPRSTKERIQALRIELLYAVQRRGGRSAIQELGQEAGVQKVKNEIRGVRKLVDWVRIFSDNFKVLPEKSDGHMVVEIASMDVSDQSMIDKALRRDEEDRKPPPPSSRSGGGRGGSDRDRDSFRDRDRGRPQGRSGGSSSSRSSHHLSPYASAAYAGYGYAMPSLGYGPPPGYAQAPLPGSPYGGYPGAPPPAGYPGAPPPAGYPGAPPPAGYPGSQPAGYPGSQPAGYPGAQPSSYPPAQPSGYPGAQPSGQPSGYPPAQSAGYPAPAQGGCCYAPPPQAGYPPPSGGGYPPSSSYPPSGGGYPPSGGSYPPSGGSYPPPSSGYPPPSSGYPPPSSGYPPPSSGYPPPSSGYPPPAQGGGYPPAGPPANGYPPPQGYHQAPPPGSYPYPVA